MDRPRPADSSEVLERFHSGLELVEVLARQVHRIAGAELDLDELLSAGREGLLLAARRYDASRNVPFPYYASFRVQGAILDWLRSVSVWPRGAHARLIALEAAVRVGGDLEPAPPEDESSREARGALDGHLAALTMASILAVACDEANAPAGPGEDPETLYAEAEELARVREELERLSPEKAEIIRRHYFEGHRLEEIATDLGTSTSWVSRLHRRTIALLAARLGSERRENL